MWSMVEVERQKWDVYWEKIPRANLMQSWQYGDTKAQTQKWRPLRFMLKDEEKQPKGLLQVLTLSVPLIGGIARINRGPLLFDDEWLSDTLRQDFEDAFLAICRIAVERRWWYLMMAPEVPELGKFDVVLKKMGFKKNRTAPWGSSRISLDRRPEEIREGFNRLWRRNLKKAEKMKLEIVVGSIEADLEHFLAAYEKFQKQKEYCGVPDNFIKAIVNRSGAFFDVRILYAVEGTEKQGGCLVIGHGDTCTETIRWSSKRGRILQANQFLVWHAMLLFKSLGYRWFDVGGLNTETTDGVVSFKRGLRGNEYSLLGEFALSFLNWKNVGLQTR